ncbi:hypothetical protein PC128_g7752 [Phytophthora cactorum]|nr:hypothetical protein PC121_g7562 [Phytophthora cactorum]KAG3196294.1 hypothetical protein PC128_g7752 [Phytophthora cactorum]
MRAVGEGCAHISRESEHHSDKVKQMRVRAGRHHARSAVCPHLRIFTQRNARPKYGKASFTMLAPPMPVFMQAPKKDVFAVKQCTCGAKDFMLRRKHNHNSESTSEAKQAANCPSNCPVANPAKLRRSFWRKLLGKGPKCVCPKTTASKYGLIGIPAAYADCDTVTVAGRRVPFTLDMQQRRRGSWTPLDAISEDE